MTSDLLRAGICRVVAAVIGVMTMAAAVTGVLTSPAAARKPSAVAPTQPLATLLTSHRVISTLHGRRPAGSIPALRPITGEQTVLPVLRRARTEDGVRWLRVMLPGRPNGGQGWIAQQGTVLTTTAWHVIVRTSGRRMGIYRRGRLVRSFAAVVGKRSTPTPRGRFFVEESVRMLSGAAGGPFALALSARSDVLAQFEGGPGQIAIHGVDNLGGIPGTAMSHGCVRLSDGPLRWLVARITPGAPVTIVS